MFCNRDETNRTSKLNDLYKFIYLIKMFDKLDNKAQILKDKFIYVANDNILCKICQLVFHRNMMQVT